jgi:hypothetical protein
LVSIWPWVIQKFEIFGAFQEIFVTQWSFIKPYRRTKFCHFVGKMGGTGVHHDK